MDVVEKRQAALNKNPNELFCYTPTIEGDFNYDDNCPIDYELEVKGGMIAMVMVNDPSEENSYQNGTVGILTQATADGVWLKPTGAASSCRTGNAWRPASCRAAPAAAVRRFRGDLR